MAVLVSSDKSVVNQRVQLNNARVTIGRHPGCDVPIDDASVSRLHAEIVRRDDGWHVSDLNSRNGTFVNDAKIRKSVLLEDGASIKICDVVISFQEESFPKSQRRTLVRTPDQSSGSSFGLRVESLISPRKRVEASGERHPSVVLQEDDSSRIDSRINASSHAQQVHQHVCAEDKLRTLMKIAHLLSESLERDEVLERILDFLFQLFTDADRGFIILHCADGTIRPLGFKTRRPHDEEQIRISKTIVNQVMETQCPVISSDASADDRFDLSQSVMNFRIRSIMCAPLIDNHEKSIGVIQLDTLRHAVAFKQEDLELLATIAMQASLAIQKSALFEEARRSREMQQDLALAHEVQSRFLPQSDPNLKGYRFASWYRPMQQVGGDYYDYVRLNERRVAIIVADVVGHGIAAAMLMAKVSAEARFALASTRSAAGAINRLNHRMTEMKLNRFVTLVLCIVDSRDHKIEIVNAGHMPPVIIRSDSGDVYSLPLEESGVPIGVVESFPYTSQTIELEEGDMVMLYTDGINEAMNAKGDQLTTEQMLMDVRQSQAKAPDVLQKVITDSVTRHMDLELSTDDMCLVVFGRERTEEET